MLRVNGVFFLLIICSLQSVASNSCKPFHLLQCMAYYARNIVYIVRNGILAMGISWGKKLFSPFFLLFFFLFFILQNLFTILLPGGRKHNNNSGWTMEFRRVIQYELFTMNMYKLCPLILPRYREKMTIKEGFSIVL